MGKGKRVSVNNDRPTIGFLIDNVTGEGEYQSVLWHGVSDAARKHDANLVCFVGGVLASSPFNPFEGERNVAYDLATQENVDGLILSSGTVFNFVSYEEVERFYTRYRPLPMVSVGVALKGVTSLLVDNETGLRQALVHLIEDHGYRRIAFIQGPEGNDDAEERQRIYREALAKYVLPLDPDLVAPGDFSAEAGQRAVRTFFDERKMDLEAIVAVNDATAFGAMEALQERGMLIPHDVAVVGFDDSKFATLSIPSLTTVRHPTYEQGRRAVEILLALLAGEAMPERVKLPTELVMRRSCGCPYQASTWALGETEASVATAETLESVLTTQRDAILSEMVGAVGTSRVEWENTVGWSAQLLDAFLADLQGEEASRAFLHELDKVLCQVAVHGDDVHLWHEVLSVLRRHTTPMLTGGDLVRAAELWQQAGVLIGEVEKQAQGILRHQAEQQVEVLRLISQSLIIAADIPELMNTVARQLRRLDIERGYVALYENPESSTEWGRLILAYDERGRVELERGGRRFPTCQLVPRDLLPPGKRYHFLIETLYFRHERFGYILFEVGPLDGLLYATMREPISSALKGALLVQEIRELNERLKDENLRMAAELEVTRRLQQMLLPTDEELARIEGLDIAGWMEPAEEVGGDYYDVLQHNGSVKIGIGDVTGHGLESGVVMLMLQTAVRTLLTSGEENPVRFLEVLNQLLRDNTRRMQVDKSMTLSLLDYELGRMRLSGQHEYVIVVRAGGKVELQDTLDLGFPLGIEHGIAQWVDEMDIALAPGDGVVLYSDGITEAEDERGEFYGLERLCEVVSASWERSAEEVKDAVMANVKGFIGDQRVYDDLTLVVAKQR